MIRKSTMTKEDKKMCRSIYWRTMTISSTYNYETMQALGFMYTMMPAINRFYKTEEERTTALERHNELFNTTPTTASLITGLVASMEKEASESKNFDTTSISAVKVALMGPLAGIGDSMFWGSLRIISLGVGIGLAQQGSILGAFLHLLIFNVPAHLIRYYGVFMGYQLGGNFMKTASESGIMGKITKGASIVGLMTVGAMACTMTDFKITKVFDIQGTPLELQPILDSIFPNMLPLILTFFCYKGIKKGMSPALLIVLVLIFGTAGKLMGIF